MAIFRKVHTSIWGDGWFSDLEKDKKLFYLYLLTNEKTKQCGVYELTKKQISFDTGYNIDRVSILLKYFIDIDKIMYNEETKEIALRNWLKYNQSSSPKVVACINKEFSEVKDRVLIEYVKGIYTRSQEEQEEEQEQEEEKIFSDEIRNFTNSLSKYFDKKIIEDLTDKQKENWKETVDKLIRLDKYSEDEITKAVKFGREDDFWKDNFLTLPKLRKKKDDVSYMHRFLQQSNKKQNGNNKQSIGYSNDIWDKQDS